MFIRLLYVDVAVLHSGFDNAAKFELMRRFNDSENKLMILIIMHFVLFQKMNFDVCCNKILMITNVINVFQK